MAKKRFSPELIVTLLRQIEVATSSGKSVGVACREAGISEQSFARRITQRGDLLQHQGSAGANRAMAPSLQHCQAALIAGISAPGTLNFCAADVPSRWDIGYAVTSITLEQKSRQADGVIHRALK